MEHLAAVALVVAMFALPACAQRGGSRGGFSGHAASASRGGFAASAHGRVSGYRGFPAGRAPGVARSVQRGFAGNLAGHAGGRSPYTGSWRYRRPYTSPYRVRFPYVFPGYGWVAPYFLEYPDDTDYDDLSGPAVNGSEEYAMEPPDEERQAPLGPYQPRSDMARPAPAPAPANEVAVTLIFKDGRPPEQIHNYILTRTTLYVGDHQRRAIPTDELDLVATAKVNQDAGVDFQLPAALR